MNDNQVISKCRGENPVPMFGLIKYDYNSGAWTPELFQWIESEGLELEFTKHIVNIAICDELMSKDPLLRWYAVAKATPQQKASALRRAIEEG